MTPLVSILIPAYNAEPWVADTIQSAIAQTWPKKEVIVVDDGSTDQTLAVVRQFASTAVKVVAQENQGAAAARNNAFSLSQGDYIQWLDADDLLAPDKVTRQVEALNQCRGKRTLLSSAYGYFKYRVRRAEFSPTSLWCDLSPSEWLLRKLEQNLFMQPATWLVSRELTEAAGPWDTRLLCDDDGEYFCRVIKASDAVRFVPSAKVFYRRTANSLSYIGQSGKKLEAQFLSMELHVGYLRSFGDSERIRAACLKYLQRWLIYFYPERPDIVGRAQALAADLGGRLELPRLPRKYALLARIIGISRAKRAQLHYNRLKQSFANDLDKCWFYIERGDAREN